MRLLMLLVQMGSQWKGLPMLQTRGEAIASGSTLGVVAAGECDHEGLVKMLKVGVILAIYIMCVYFHVV